MKDGSRAYIHYFPDYYIEYDMIGNTGDGDRECLIPATEMMTREVECYSDLNVEGEKRPIAFQIFGSDPEIMAYSAKMISENADIIDINMGCPAPKVVKNGDGSRLLQNPDLAKKIVEEVVKSTNKPVTVKLRIGWDKDSINIVDIAKEVEKAGSAAICVHGRTREQYYSRTSKFRYNKRSKTKC